MHHLGPFLSTGWQLRLPAPHQHVGDVLVSVPFSRWDAVRLVRAAFCARPAAGMGTVRVGMDTVLSGGVLCCALLCCFFRVQDALWVCHMSSVLPCMGMICCVKAGQTGCGELCCVCLDEGLRYSNACKLAVCTAAGQHTAAAVSYEGNGSHGCSHGSVTQQQQQLTPATGGEGAGAGTWQQCSLTQDLF